MQARGQSGGSSVLLMSSVAWLFTLETRVCYEYWVWPGTLSALAAFTLPQLPVDPSFSAGLTFDPVLASLSKQQLRLLVSLVSVSG